MSSSPDRLEQLRQALRRLAEDDAAELIAQARERARRTAAKVIEDVMVDELLQAAAACSSEPLQHDEPESEVSGDAWWAYCVLAADDAQSLPAGLDGIEPSGTVEVLCEGELAALISRVPADEYNDIRLRENLEDLAWVEQTARRHEAVLETTLSHAAVVPLRLCTIYLDVHGVRRLLREHADSLTRSLRKVEDSAEWGVKVFGDGTDVDRDPEPENEADGPASAARPGATYLVQRQRERDRAERAGELRARCAQAVHERVSTLARAAISNPPQRPELHGREMAMLLNGAYLVANERVADLQAEIRELEAEWSPRGFVIELTGPWPAYNFVSGAGVLP